MLTSRPSGDQGAIALVVAAFAVVMFGFSAIVVDLGAARMTLGEAQSAADAAALAGSGVLSEGTSPSLLPVAVNRVKVSASTNFGTPTSAWSGCTATKPDASWQQQGSGTDCILFQGAPFPTRIRVVLPVKRSGTFFGGIVGFDGINISARSRATIREDDEPGCALCLLGALDTAGLVQVAGGGSASASTGRVTGSGSVSVGSPGRISFASTPNPDSGPYVPTPQLALPQDPFSGRSLPSTAGPSMNNNFRCGAGVNSLPSNRVYGNIQVVGTCRMSGRVVATGVVDVSSVGRLTGLSATLYLACGSRTSPSSSCSGDGARLQIASGGRLSITGSASGTTFSLVAARNNTRAMTINGVVTLGREFYGRSTGVQIAGAASLTGSGRMSFRNLTLSSTASYRVTSSGGSVVAGPIDVGLTIE